MKAQTDWMSTGAGRMNRRECCHRLGRLGAGLFLPGSVLSACRWIPEREALVTMDFIGGEPEWRYYQTILRNVKRLDPEVRDFEAAVNGFSRTVFLNTRPVVKPSQILMLLEQGKDILTPYPMGRNLDEYSRMITCQARSGHFTGLLNPLRFMPVIAELQMLLHERSCREIRVTCHPVDIHPGFPVAGLPGPAQLLQRSVSWLLDRFPEILRAERKRPDDNLEITLHYGAVVLMITLDPRQTGWTLRCLGRDWEAFADYTGLLSVDAEPQARLEPDPRNWEKALIMNIDDFAEAVRNREEPKVNHLDGLAGIILANAVQASLVNEESIEL